MALTRLGGYGFVFLVCQRAATVHIAAQKHAASGSPLQLGIWRVLASLQLNDAYLALIDLGR